MENQGLEAKDALLCCVPIYIVLTPRLSTVMLSFLTPLADDGIGYAYGFVFVGTNLAAAILVWFFLYESVGLSLEHVDVMYSDPKIKPISSGKWVPEGWISRKEKRGSVSGAPGSAAAVTTGRASDSTAYDAESAPHGHTTEKKQQQDSPSAMFRENA